MPTPPPQNSSKEVPRRRPTAAEVAAATDRLVPDIIGPHMKLLLVGINPGLWSAATGTHFARPGNRFWPAMYSSGITTYRFDVSAGYHAPDVAHLIERGIGLTNIVSRATARAAELRAEELQGGVERIRQLVRTHQPAVVAFLGITSYRQAFRQPRAQLGRQDGQLVPEVATQTWVLPNPSGLNAHALPATLAVDFAEVGRAAGIQVARFPVSD